ncbi:MAG: glycosyltransferase family 1 protein [Saprospiraceae bacterium]|nr:glycosyltransferase family 1 protein [Saprospiraceae bacterium]
MFMGVFLFCGKTNRPLVGNLMYRIGFDAKRLFNNFTGLGNYSRTLLRNLAEFYPENAYFLYTPKVTKNEETQFFLNSPLYSVHLPQGQPKAYWRSWGVKKDLRKHKIQLFHGLSHEIPVGIQKTKIKSIVTIHDLVFKHYPHHFPLIDRQIYDYKFHYACENANKIIAISESTKRDIIEFYNITAEKIEVIYQSCHERFMQEKSPKAIEAVLKRYQLPGGYFFYVGSVIERKNLLSIVQALELLPSDLKLPLVVVGDGKAYKNKVQEYIARKNLQKQVIFIKADYDDLPALYQQAKIFIYPSVYEGFGIPILEALFSKTPVITSNISSLPEAGGPDSYLIDPRQPEQIAAGIQKILSNDAFRKEMIEKGFAYAQRFKGAPLTEQLMELYETLI